MENKKFKMETNTMKVISQNLLKYDVEISEDAMFRFNLAWHNDLKLVAKLLHSDDFKDSRIFLDVPIGRRKPPNYEHDINDVAAMVSGCKNIEYVAISNIENESQVLFYQEIFKESFIVPKIESYIGLKNVKEILLAINYLDKIIMLDHQDLYSDLARMGVESDYLSLVAALEDGCKKAGVRLLKTVGIVFSDEGVL